MLFQPGHEKNCSVGSYWMPRPGLYQYDIYSPNSIKDIQPHVCVMKSYKSKLLKTRPSRRKPFFIKPCPISSSDGYRYQENLQRNMLGFSSKFLDTYAAGIRNSQSFHGAIRASSQINEKISSLNVSSMFEVKIKSH